jgi:hypothetical protein
MRGLHRKLSYRPAFIAVKEKGFPTNDRHGNIPFDAVGLVRVPRI